MIELNCFQSPIGLITILTIKQGVVKILFGSQSHEDLNKFLNKHINLNIQDGNTYTHIAKNQILSYLSGKRNILDFSVIHFNSPFRKKVLEVQRNIPYGETRSYIDIATILKHPKSIRAVGGANANNPLPLYYPCHRIIYADGSLGEFIGGRKVKQWLLDLETRWH